MTVEVVLRKSKMVAEYKDYTDKYGIEHHDTVLKEEKIQPTEFVKVTYSEPKLPGFEGVHESIEFPYEIETLNKRIEHYENKIRYIKEKKNG